MHRIEFCGEMLPRLGFGTMRLPVREDRTVDEEKTAEMIRYAMAHGVNYFDTAYPYHDGKSEVITGKILREFPGTVSFSLTNILDTRLPIPMTRRAFLKISYANAV